MVAFFAFAEERGLTPTLNRAISFHPEIQQKLEQTTVEWSFAFARTAGNAKFAYNPLIKLHIGLQRQGAVSINETFLHEAAHIMAHAVYGANVQPHGMEWVEMMHQLGQKPT